MKKITIPFLLFCIIASVILSSCSSTNSITKRRYTKGYYISHTKSRHTQPVKHEKAALAKISTPIQVVPKNDGANLPQENKSFPITIGTPVVTANNSPVAHPGKNKVAVKDPNNLVLKHNALPAEFSVKKPFKSIDKSLIQKHSGDALSLLWIVIVVLLILWLVGLIGGNVLGGLIHLLLIIALILLILWLLRIL